MSAAQKPVTKIVEFDVQEVAIRSIEILPDLLQTRAKTDAEVVKVYSDAKASGSVFPPVVVFETEDGRKLLADGFHRVEAWRKLGLRSIKAVLRPGTMEDAILFGIEANFSATNIREVTENDRMHAVKVMLRNEVFRMWSDRGISKTCGVSAPTVGRIRLDLFQKEHVPVPDRVLLIQNNRPLPSKRTFRYTITGSINHQNKRTVQPVGLVNEGDLHYTLSRAEAISEARRIGDPSPGNGWRRLLWRMADLLELQPPTDPEPTQCHD